MKKLNLLLIIVILFSSTCVSQQVPDTESFDLDTVVVVVNPTHNNLDSCFSQANAGYFNDTYYDTYYAASGNKLNILMFRDYGSHNSGGDTTLSNGLIARYKFNESNGDLIDYVGGFNFTVNSITAREVVGVTDSAYYFNGSSDFLSIATSPLSQLSITDTMVMAIRFKTETVSSFHYLWHANPTVTGEYGAWGYINNSTLWGGSRWSAGSVSTNAGNIDNSNWHVLWIRIYYNGTNIHYESNLNTKATWTSSQQIVTLTGWNSTSAIIGKFNNVGAYYWQGWIDDISIWDRDVPDSQRTNYVNGVDF